MSNEHTWDKYQKLILEELKSLRKGQDKISKDVDDLKEIVAGFESTKDFVGELKKIATLRQTEEIYEDVNKLNIFKNKALLIASILQFVYGFVLWFVLYNK